MWTYVFLILQRDSVMRLALFNVQTAAKVEAALRKLLKTALNFNIALK